MTRGSRPLRVVVVDHTAELGGAELALVRLCAALGPAIELHVLLFADGPLRGRLEALGTSVEVLALDPTVARVDRRAAVRLGPAQLRRIGVLLPFLVRLVRRLHWLQPDVVCTTSLKADLLGGLATLLVRRPLVWHVHDRISPDYLPRPLVWLLRGAARLPDQVLVNSRATAATLPVPTTLAYPGYAPEQAVRRRGVQGTGQGRVVGMVGRISETKGQLELVRAVPRILAREPDTWFRIIGEPAFGATEYADSVRLEARRLGVEERIRWVGFVEDPTAELGRLDVFVHASPVPEPFGQVVVEAMLLEVPVVATDGGGVPEILVDEDGTRLGELVRPGDPESLALGVLAVLARPESARRRAVRAGTSARHRFTVDRTAATVTEVWSRAAGHGRAPRPSGGPALATSVPPQ